MREWEGTTEELERRWRDRSDVNTVLLYKIFKKMKSSNKKNHSLGFEVWLLLSVSEALLSQVTVN